MQLVGAKIVIMTDGGPKLSEYAIQFEIIDCTICCNPNKIDYEVDESGISTLSITDGND